MATRLVVALVSVAGVASAAQASVIDLASFSYDALAGTYVESSPGVGNFSAVAVDLPGLRSSGTVTRLTPPVATARFPRSFMSNPLRGSSNFNLNLSVNVTGSGTGTGLGTFRVTDVDGDEIVGTIGGAWAPQGSSFIIFQGALSNVTFVDNGVQDNLFNGLTGAIQMSPFPALPPFTGALVQLTFGAPSFFNGSFTNRNTAVSAQIIPAPAALAVLGMGGLLAARRRR